MPAAITRLQAIALPLLRDNLDTDELIPVSENTRVSMTGWGDGLFAARRYLDGTNSTPDPGFILNQAPYERAEILVSGDNFGCGSSRESAVWALRDFGFKIVIATSFNETFLRNCIVNGLAPLVMNRQDAESLVVEIIRAPFIEVAVDLAGGTLRHGARDFAFKLDPFYCALLTTGQTEEDLLQALQPDIDRRRDAMTAAAPWLRSEGLGQSQPL